MYDFLSTLPLQFYKNSLRIHPNNFFKSRFGSSRKNYQKAGGIRRHFEYKKGQIQSTISDNPRTKKDIQRQKMTIQ